MRTNFVKFSTTDKLSFPAILYETEKETKRAAIWLHGCGGGSILSVDRMNSIGKALDKKGISFLTFNNRGALIIDFIKRVNADGIVERIPAGTAYELIKDCVIDIDSAIEYLKKLGYEEFYLIGHSTGANKICVYNYYKPENEILKYIILEGGDDTGLFYEEMGKEKYFKVLDRCKKEIADGNGMDLTPKSVTSMIYSYQSLFDTINPDGDYNTFPFKEYSENLHLSKKELFREYKSIKKPTLVVYAENSEYSLGLKKTFSILKDVTDNAKNFEYKGIKETDHGFYGKEKELANLIANWLGGRE